LAQEGKIMPEDPVEKIIALDREIASLEAALAAQPGNIESYQLGQTLEFRQKQRQQLEKALSPSEGPQLRQRRAEKNSPN
jgi:hypothetical protein